MQYIIGIDSVGGLRSQPIAQADRTRKILRPDFAQFGSTLFGAVSSGEIARLIGECPISWDMPGAAHV
jgi:hypothetical protein